MPFYRQTPRFFPVGCGVETGGGASQGRGRPQTVVLGAGSWRNIDQLVSGVPGPWCCGGGACGCMMRNGIVQENDGGRFGMGPDLGKQHLVDV
jgi:hypothetical protein